MTKQVSTVEELLARTSAATEDHEQISLDLILSETGRRSFGPLLLLIGLALTAFGLALVIHDGVVAILALAITAITLALVLYFLLT